MEGAYAFGTAEEALDAIEMVEACNKIEEFSKTWSGEKTLPADVSASLSKVVDAYADTCMTEAASTLAGDAAESPSGAAFFASFFPKETSDAPNVVHGRASAPGDLGVAGQQVPKVRPAIGSLEALTIENVAQQKKGMGDSSMLGASGYERNERDLYSTEPAVTHALCQYLVDTYLSPSDLIWEPAVGKGAMRDVIAQYFAGVIASDIVPLCDDAFEADFLRAIPKQKATAILTNPPYGAAIDDFMRRAIDLLRRETTKPLRLVAFVARHELDCASGRTQFFKNCPEFFGKLVLTWRPRWIEGSTGSPRHNYAIYLWARVGSFAPIKRAFTDYLVKRR